jgi:hypothetical protein
VKIDAGGRLRPAEMEWRAMPTAEWLTSRDVRPGEKALINGPRARNCRALNFRSGHKRCGLQKYRC